MKSRIIEACNDHATICKPNLLTRMKMWRLISIVNNAGFDSLFSDINAFIKANLDDTYFYLNDSRWFISKLITLMLKELKKDGRLNQYTDVEQENLLQSSLPFHLDEMKNKFSVLSELCEIELSNHAINLLLQGSMQKNSILSRLPRDMIYEIADKLCDSYNKEEKTNHHKKVGRRYTFFSIMHKKRNPALQAADAKPEGNVLTSSNP